LTLAANSDQIRISVITLTQNELTSAGTDHGTESMNIAKRKKMTRSMFARLLIGRVL
jgi:hypothetical protein